MHGEMMKFSARSYVITGLLLFFLLFVGGGVWAWQTRIAGAVIAPGRLVVSGKPKTVQHLDGGIVTRIHVQDGDHVRKGQVLLELDDVLLKANLSIYANRLRERLATRARLLAERDGAERIRWDNALLDLLGIAPDEKLMHSQERLFAARMATRKAQIARLKEKIKQLGNQAAGIRALMKSKNVQLSLLSKELSSVLELRSKGLTSRTRVLDLQRQQEDLLGQIAEHTSALARVNNAIKETEMQILQIEEEARQTTLAELQKAEREIGELTQQFYATREKLKRVKIRAPVSGVVHELTVTTVGAVIRPGAVIMQIVPQTGDFEVEVSVEPKFIDDIYPGQKAAVEFTAFDHRTIPALKGRIRTISPNVVVNQRTGAAFYKVVVDIPETELALLKGKALVTGMPVEAFFTTGEQSVLAYLLRPLEKQLKHAFREK